MHIDMDSFFASVEMHENPKLRDVPLVICVYSGRTEDSGAVATANYIAREYGVKSGIPIVFAKKMLANVKEAVFLPLRKDYYKGLSDEVFELVESKVDKIEVASIDEAYCDVSSTGSYEEAIRRATEIKKDIKENFGLTCSIGIAGTKIAAKIASDMEKPDGLTVVEDIKMIQELPIGKIPGIGPKTEQKLKDTMIEKIIDISSAGKSRIVELLGETIGTRMHDFSNGVDDREVEEKERKQLSSILTLKENSRDLDYLAENIERAYHELLKRKTKGFRNFSIILVTTDLNTYTKSRTFQQEPSEGQVKSAIKDLVEEFLGEKAKEIRRVGARMAYFEEEQDKKQKSLSEY